HDPSYFIAIFSAVLISIIVLNQQKQIPSKFLQVADAFGLALFAVMGTQKAMSIGMPATTSVIMGVLTGCFGGVIRDVLAGDIPLLLKGQLYAITCILGGIVYTQLMSFSIAIEVSMLFGMLTTLVVRLMAMRYNWVIHVFKY
ncbi:trimeric intracellular cation channel family protein, partial [Pseudoalteromonas phenolica]